jgi:hypothetical protein
VRANHPNQPLGQDGDHAAGDEERFDSEIDEPDKGAGRVLRTSHRTEDQASAERRLHGGLGGCPIAHLADRDDVRALSDDGLQGVGERQAVLDLALADAATKAVFDRVLGGEDLSVGPIQVAEGGVQGRGLARARRAGHEDKAARTTMEDLPEALEVLRIKAQVLDANSIGDAEDRRLAVLGRQDADAQVQGHALDQ